MASRALLVELRLLQGRYHGQGDWPPSPFRVFQALVAGAYGGRWRAEPPEEKNASFEWLERLHPPLIVAPAKIDASATTYFVPNNDLDAVGGDPRRVSEIRAGKTARPILFDGDAPILYAWAFDEGEIHARRLCDLADRLHTLGWGVDAAFAHAEVLDWDDGERRLIEHGGIIAHPGSRGSARAPTCPVAGSLASLMARFDAGATRFRQQKEGRRSVTFFRRPPKASFTTVAYNRPPARLLLEMRRADDPAALHGVGQERAVDVAKSVRDLVARRLRDGLTGRSAEIDRVVVGREAGPADVGRRIRFLPLPSIGHPHADPAIRRVLLEIPPDCPLSAEEVSWAISGQSVIDPETGEISSVYAPAEDHGMLHHYGIGRRARRWQSVTPVALPFVRRRGRLGGPGRAEDEGRAAAAVVSALRHAGRVWRGVDIRVQAEPFRQKGARADSFRPDRFAGRLRHVEITFPEAVTGPLVIGDGRWLGLGLLAPVRDPAPTVHVFSVDRRRAPPASSAVTVARALRRAVMARVDARRQQERPRNGSPMGRASGSARDPLPVLFTGHAPDGPPARSGRHEHLFFLADDADDDGRIDRLSVIAPERVDRSAVSDADRREVVGHLRLLDRAMAGFDLLRAGRAGVLRLSRVVPEPGDDDAAFGRARRWVSRTPYRPTRHAHGIAAEEGVRRDLIEECARRGLPRPEVDILGVEVGPRGGILARARLRFRQAVRGPLVLGRGSHFGAGMFVAEE